MFVVDTGSSWTWVTVDNCRADDESQALQEVIHLANVNIDKEQEEEHDIEMIDEAPDEILTQLLLAYL